MAKQISNNYELQRYLLILDIAPNIGPVEGFTSLLWRNRTVNITTFRVLDRIAPFLNLLSKQMRKLQRSNSLRFNFRWNVVLFDRLTGIAITGAQIGGLRLQQPTEAPRPSDQGKPVIIAGTPEAKEVRKLQQLYNALLEKERLQPTLLMNEDPTELLRVHTIQWNIGLQPTEAVQPIKDDVLDTNILSSGLLDAGKFSLPHGYPENLRTALKSTLLHFLTELFADLNQRYHSIIRDRLGHIQNLSEREIRRANIEELRVDQTISLSNTSLVQAVIQHVIFQRIDVSDVENAIEKMKAFLMPGFADQFTRELGYSGTVAPLYMSRDLLNGEEVVAWARSQGFPFCFNPQDMHTTILYSKGPVQWDLITPDRKGIIIPAGARRIKALGDKGATVINFDSAALSQRNGELMALGATSDFVGFLGHTTFTYKGKTVDLGKVAPYMGKLEFGPEIMKEIKDDFDPGELREIDLAR